MLQAFTNIQLDDFSPTQVGFSHLHCTTVRRHLSRVYVPFTPGCRLSFIIPLFFLANHARVHSHVILLRSSSSLPLPWLSSLHFLHPRPYCPPRPRPYCPLVLVLAVAVILLALVPLSPLLNYIVLACSKTPRSPPPHNRNRVNAIPAAVTAPQSTTTTTSGSLSRREIEGEQGQ